MNDGFRLGEGLEMLPEGTVVRVLDSSDLLFIKVELVESGCKCLIRRCDLQAYSPLKILADQAE